jgi:hypothetical protein
MAPRIPVVFSQAAGLTPQQRDHEETLIAEMLMEDRIEVSLIGAMEQLHEEDTDRLCLMGFQGDFILLSSLDSAAAFRELERLEVEGSQGKTMFEPAADLRADQTRRKIYHIPVVEQARGEVRKEVQRLREDAQIATVPLLGIDGSTAISSSGTPSGSPATPEPVTPAPAKPARTKPAPAKSTTAPAKSTTPPQSQASRKPGFDEWEDDEVDSQLDSLVDELDDMDL